uniref:SFRICE_033712 n=1 Tax=Spodoptera frugiperda TaxID=7108 RepID=A0A2H1VAK2_SPOFR
MIAFSRNLVTSSELSLASPTRCCIRCGDGKSPPLHQRAPINVRSHLEIRGKRVYVSPDGKRSAPPMYTRYTRAVTASALQGTFVERHVSPETSGNVGRRRTTSDDIATTLLKQFLDGQSTMSHMSLNKCS